MLDFASIYMTRLAYKLVHASSTWIELARLREVGLKGAYMKICICYMCKLRHSCSRHI